MSDAAKLFAENQGLAYAVIRDKFSWLLGDEDYQQVALIGLWKAAQAYDDTKNVKFSAFAYVCIANEIKMELRRQTKQKLPNCISLDKLMSEDGSTVGETLKDTSLSDFDVFIMSENILNSFTGRDAQLIDYVLEGLTQEEMARRMGLSQGQISRLISKIKDKVRGVYEC